MRPVALVPVLLLLLAACSSEPTAAGDTTTPNTPTPHAEPAVEIAEGPVSSGPHAWPDGVTAAVVSVTSSPAVAPEIPAEDTDVIVVVEFGNQGATTLSFGESPNQVDAGPAVALLYGANRTSAHQWYYEANTLPTQLTPGTTARWTASFTMPGAELGTLAVTVSPTDAHPPWTFTGAETLAG